MRIGVVGRTLEVASQAPLPARVVTRQARKGMRGARHSASLALPDSQGVMRVRTPITGEGVQAPTTRPCKVTIVSLASMAE